MDGHFEIAVENLKKNEKVLIINLKGEIDEYSLPEFKKELSSIIADEKIDTFIFFLKDLKFVNSVVISHFAEIYTNLNQKEKKLIFAEGNAEIFDIFDLVGFFNLVEYYDKLDEAIASLEF